MLSESERATLREIEKDLSDDPGFTRSFRTGTVATPNRRSRTLGEFAAWAVLLAAVLVIVGAYGAAVLVAAGATAFGLTSHIESRAPSGPPAPGRPESSGT